MSAVGGFAEKAITEATGLARVAGDELPAITRSIHNVFGQGGDLFMGLRAGFHNQVDGVIATLNKAHNSIQPGITAGAHKSASLAIEAHHAELAALAAEEAAQVNGFAAAQARILQLSQERLEATAPGEQAWVDARLKAMRERSIAIIQAQHTDVFRPES